MQKRKLGNSKLEVSAIKYVGVPHGSSQNFNLNRFINTSHYEAELHPPVLTFQNC